MPILTPAAIDPKIRDAERLADIERRLRALERSESFGVGALVRGTATLASPAAVTLTYSLEIFDYGGLFDPGANDRLTAIQDGIYAVIITHSYSADAAGYRQAVIRQLPVGGGTTVLSSPTHPAVNGDVTTIDATSVVFLARGDAIQITARQTSGNSVGVTADLTLLRIR